MRPCSGFRQPIIRVREEDELGRMKTWERGEKGGSKLGGGHAKKVRVREEED